MTEDEYWDVVAKVDWPGICDDPNAHRDAGKRILLSLLVTQDEMKTFRNVHYHLKGILEGAMRRWEIKQDQVNPNWGGWGVGDDGFDDLTNHIVGCGKVAWAMTCCDPQKAYDRTVNKWSKGRTPTKPSEGFVESFLYCIPYDKDYDPAEVKLARAVKSLHHWINMAAKNCVHRADGGDAHDRLGAEHFQPEILSITDEIVGLEDQIQRETGTVSDYTANIDERIHVMKIKYTKRLLADCLDERIKLEIKIKETRENLDSLLAE